MILHMGGGGGCGGGDMMKVITAATLPDEVTEKSICVVMSGTAGKITIGTARPVTPASGDVWVKVLNTSPNVVGFDGASEMKLALAQMYNGTQWENCDAYYAFCKEWVKFSDSFTMLGYEWKYDNSSPTLTRIDGAVGLSASGGIGTVGGSSDFDDIAIFKDIKLCNLAADGTVNAYEGETGFARDGSNGDVMVEIPKFWYKVEVDTTAKKRRFRICNQEVTGFSVHPMFDRGGTPKEHVYVGAYEMGAAYSSKSGVAPLVSLTRAEFRTGAAAKGTGWSMNDVATRLGIADLMRIEFATMNIQAVLGAGNSNTSAAINTGSTDGITGHTGRAAGTDTASGVKWRGIENPYGNVWEWIDGLNFNNGAFYYCLDQSNFKDDSASGYTLLGFTVGTALSSTYGNALGYDSAAPWADLPSAHTGASETTYLCDACWSSTGWQVADCGGYWANGGACGLDCWGWDTASSSAGAYIGARLLFIP